MGKTRAREEDSHLDIRCLFWIFSKTRCMTRSREHEVLSMTILDFGYSQVRKTDMSPRSWRLS
jgi:hypothetical protein